MSILGGKVTSRLITHRSSLLDQEDITRKSVAWLRGKVHDVKYHLTSTNYQAWFNEYLQTLTLPPNFPKEISESTANR